MVREMAKAEPQAGPQLFVELFGLTVDQARRSSADTAAMAAHLRLMAAFPPGVPRARKMARMTLAWAKAQCAGRKGAR